MATKKQILDYVEHTPLNTNRFVLEQMLSSLGDGGEGGGGNITANVKKEGNVTTITISDGVTTTTAQVYDGEKGEQGEQGVPGQDGFSPIVTVRNESDGSATIVVEDAEGIKETHLDIFNPDSIEEINGGTSFHDW